MKQNSIFKRREDLQWKKIEEEVVLFDDAEGKVFRFDPVAAEIWSLLSGNTPVSGIAKHLIEVFDVSVKQAEKDVDNFLKRLSCLDLIQEVKDL